ncbi:GNAT family N-acetyltransferase [Tissierella sp.]|uniref:GNAT family N-acetyltransferase n=1 Tax=Tissierella sp. TaxID=41274 RepID=UPI002861491A|nr:GNAT family N-acetyltransferase [Tissierella sp.]MDR7856503.1 GNAT family N-acetyltransferase [Tissierella sp.]
MQIKNSKIVLKEKINHQDSVDISNLQNICLEKDKITLKLEIDYKLSINDKEKDVLDHINEFLYYDDNRLVGYIGICDFGGDAIEVNGMVHPKYRRRRIFTKLFSLVKNEWENRKPKRILLLSDSKSITGLGFISSLGAKHVHSEYEMFYNSHSRAFELSNNICFRKAADKDLKEISRQNSIYFDSEYDEDSTSISDEERMDGMNTYMAEIDNKIIGKVRLETISNFGGIYGLGVLPEYRGRGYGRDILTWSVKKLKETDSKEIVLQVSVSNENALNLYKSTGFEIKSKMDYFELT